jgi:hypothetical protein
VAGDGVEALEMLQQVQITLDQLLILLDGQHAEDEATS